MLKVTSWLSQPNQRYCSRDPNPETLSDWAASLVPIHDHHKWDQRHGSTLIESSNVFELVSEMQTVFHFGLEATPWLVLTALCAIFLRVYLPDSMKYTCHRFFQVCIAHAEGMYTLPWCPQDMYKGKDLIHCSENHDRSNIWLQKTHLYTWIPDNVWKISSYELIHACSQHQ